MLRKGFEMSARESERGEMVGLGEMSTEAEIRCNLLKVGYLPFIQPLQFSTSLSPEFLRIT